MKITFVKVFKYFAFSRSIKHLLRVYLTVFEGVPPPPFTGFPASWKIGKYQSGQGKPWKFQNISEKSENL